MGGVTIAVPPMHLDQQQQPNLLQMASQVYGIKNQQQEGQARALEIQKQQQALKDQNAATAAIKAWDGKDPEALRKGIIDNGGSANAAFAAQQHLLGIKEQASKIAADDATTGAKNIETLKGKSDAIAGAVNGLKSLPDEQLIPAAQQKIQELQQSGMLSPQEAQQAGSAIGQMQDPKKVRDSLDGIAKMHTFQSQQMSKAKDDADLAAKAAALPGIQAHSKQEGLTLAGTNAQGMTAAQQSEAASRANTLKVEQGKLAEEKRYHDIQSGMGGPTAGGVTGPTQISQVPDAIRGTVQGILDYRQNMPPMTRSNPRNSMIQYWVNKLDPQYDASQFPARNKLIQNYTSGPQSKEINAINTAMGHVGVLGDALTALDNGDVKAINSIANKFGIQVGQTPAATVNLIVHRVGPELTSAYVQGGGGEADRGTTASDFDTSLGKDILKANVGTTAKLLRSKIGALENQYQQTVKRDDFQQRFITPEAQAALDKYSAKGSGHVIQIGDKKYQYKGSGNTADLSNYTELK